jgi:hypothetical protein
MLVYEYKLDGSKKQYAAIEEAIRTAQFIRNKCLRLWMDGKNVSNNDLQAYCAVLAKEYPLPRDSTPKPVKPVPTVPGLLSLDSMTTARTTNLERKGILSFNTTTGA